MNKWLAPLILAVFTLTACKGVGMGQMSSKGWFEESDEEKAEDKFWDKLYGRKSSAPESSDWKDYYKPPNQDDTKPDYCGFWGNCAADSATANQQADCNFYGNCGDGVQKKAGWW